jgi:hypothetical protein
LGILYAGSLLLFLFILGSGLFSFSLPFFRKKDVTSLPVRRYKGRILLPAVIFALALLSLGTGFIQRGRAGKGPERGNRGILRAAEIRRVPDPGGGVDFWFGDGQSVIVRGVSPAWVFVEAPDGRTGWAPEDRLILY